MVAKSLPNCNKLILNILGVVWIYFIPKKGTLVQNREFTRKNTVKKCGFLKFKIWPPI